MPFKKAFAHKIFTTSPCNKNPCSDRTVLKLNCYSPQRPKLLHTYKLKRIWRSNIIFAITLISYFVLINFIMLVTQRTLPRAKITQLQPLAHKHFQGLLIRRNVHYNSTHVLITQLTIKMLAVFINLRGYHNHFNTVSNSEH